MRKNSQRLPDSVQSGELDHEEGEGRDSADLEGGMPDPTLRDEEPLEQGEELGESEEPGSCRGHWSASAVECVGDADNEACYISEDKTEPDGRVRVGCKTETLAKKKVPRKKNAGSGKVEKEGV